MYLAAERIVPSGRTTPTRASVPGEDRTMQVKCPKCGQLIALNDIIESSNGHLSHVDCMRPRTLTVDERHLLFVYCWDHLVAQCLSCSLSFRMTEMAADPLGGRTNICPRCRKDLTENVRTHLYGCAKLPVEVRLRAQALREAAQGKTDRSPRSPRIPFPSHSSVSAPSRSCRTLPASLCHRK